MALAQNSLANVLRIYCYKFARKLRFLRAEDEGSATLPKTERMARDVGLTPSEFERLNLKLPSREVAHPYL